MNQKNKMSTIMLDGIYEDFFYNNSSVYDENKKFEILSIALILHQKYGITLDEYEKFLTPNNYQDIDSMIFVIHTINGLKYWSIDEISENDLPIYTQIECVIVESKFRVSTQINTKLIENFGHCVIEFIKYMQSEAKSSKFKLFKELKSKSIQKTKIHFYPYFTIGCSKSLDISSINEYVASEIRSFVSGESCSIQILEENDINTIWRQFKRYTGDKTFSFNDNPLYIKTNEKLRMYVGPMSFRNLFDTLMTDGEDPQLNDAFFEENVRYFLETKASSYDPILKTLKKDPQNFIFYNNGITILTDKINATAGPEIGISSPSIVNGCQTVQTVFSVFKKDKDNKKWNDTTVFVRIIESLDLGLSSEITTYNNTQTPVNAADLSSLTQISIELETLFKQYAKYDISFYYARKKGKDKSYGRYKVDPSYIRRAYGSYIGKPIEASQSQELFTIHDAFNSMANIQDLYNATLIFFLIERKFKEGKNISNKIDSYAKYIITRLIALELDRESIDIVSLHDPEFFSQLFQKILNKLNEMDTVWNKTNCRKKEIVVNILPNDYMKT